MLEKFSQMEIPFERANRIGENEIRYRSGFNIGAEFEIEHKRDRRWKGANAKENKTRTTLTTIYLCNIPCR